MIDRRGHNWLYGDRFRCRWWSRDGERREWSLTHLVVKGRREEGVVTDTSGGQGKERGGSGH